jgi:glutamine amidotransferase
MKISIVDYGVGNIFSVGQALKSLGLNFSLDADGSSISHSDLVIVPGVAAFGIGMKNLQERGQAEELRSFYQTGKPLIGLCLGAQMFLNSSAESPLTEGFGFVSGVVSALDEKKCRVPQQGWSQLHASESTTFSIFHQEYFYFSHSYKMNLGSTETAVHSSRHDQEVVTAFFVDKNVLGVQFHPERSGPKGLKFLEKAVLSANIWA